MIDYAHPISVAHKHAQGQRARSLLLPSTAPHAQDDRANTPVVRLSTNRNGPNNRLQEHGYRPPIWRIVCFEGPSGNGTRHRLPRAREPIITLYRRSLGPGARALNAINQPGAPSRRQTARERITTYENPMSQARWNSMPCKPIPCQSPKTRPAQSRAYKEGKGIDAVKAPANTTNSGCLPRSRHSHVRLRFFCGGQTSWGPAQGGEPTSCQRDPPAMHGPYAVYRSPMSGRDSEAAEGAV